MICPACGFANEDGVLFCEKCKADLDMPVAAAPVEEPVPLEPVSDVYRPGVEPPELPPPVVELEPMDEPSTEDRPAVRSSLPSDTAESTTGPAPPRVPTTPSAPESAEPATVPAPGEMPTVQAVPSAPMTARLVVVRGQRIDVKYPLYPGKNYLGRTDDKPVDIDLEDQEAADRIWTSRQHAVITLEEGRLVIEDLGSLNGTFVNRARVHPGQIQELQENDVIQVGTVHMKVVLG
jgi:hypothetical protein